MAPEEFAPETESDAARQPYVTPQLELHDDWDLVTGIDLSEPV